MSNRNPRTIEQLRALVGELESIRKTVADAYEKMSSAKLESVMSSGDTVLRAYIPAMQRFATKLAQDVAEAVSAKNLGVPTGYELRSEEYEKRKLARLKSSRAARKIPKNSGD